MPGQYLDSFHFGRSLLLYGSDVDECPDGFVDKPAEAVFSILIDLSGVNGPPSITQAPLVLRDDADFILRSIAAWSGPSDDGGTGLDFSFRYTDSESRYLQQQTVHFSSLAGTMLNPAPVAPSVFYPAGSIAQFDVMPVSTSNFGSGMIYVVLIGQRRYKGSR